jgi:hypothetical protein
VPAWLQGSPTPPGGGIGGEVDLAREDGGLGEALLAGPGKVDIPASLGGGIRISAGGYVFEAADRVAAGQDGVLQGVEPLGLGAYDDGFGLVARAEAGEKQNGEGAQAGPNKKGRRNVRRPLYFGLSEGIENRRGQGRGDLIVGRLALFDVCDVG